MLGQIILTGISVFIPVGYHECDGTLLPVSQYAALFSLLGTLYGGDGQTTFGLPDLRGRVPLGAYGTAPLPSVLPGAKGGAAAVTLAPANMPGHTHPAVFTGAPGPTGTVQIAIPAVASTANTTATPDSTLSLANSVDPTGNATPQIYSSDTTTTALKPFTAPVAGSKSVGTVTIGTSNSSVAAAFSILPPYLGLRWLIATQGTYPERP
jgi:microcystin-dependent protein